MEELRKPRLEDKAILEMLADFEATGAGMTASLAELIFVYEDWLEPFSWQKPGLGLLKVLCLTFSLWLLLRWSGCGLS